MKAWIATKPNGVRYIVGNRLGKDDQAPIADSLESVEGHFLTNEELEAMKQEYFEAGKVPEHGNVTAYELYKGLQQAKREKSKS